jgi:hypothetical protein
MLPGMGGGCALGGGGVGIRMDGSTAALPVTFTGCEEGAAGVFAAGLKGSLLIASLR